MPPKSAHLDDLDRQILAILQDEGRVTNVELARRIGVSPASALERTRKLERSGVIRKYAAILDAEHLGQRLAALVTVTLREHGTKQLADFKRAVTKLPEVRACWHMAGEADFVLHVLVQDMQAYERFVVEKLTATTGVGRIRTNFILDVVKDETGVGVAK